MEQKIFELETQLNIEKKKVKDLEKELRGLKEEQTQKDSKVVTHHKHRTELLEKQMDFCCRLIDSMVIVLFGERLGQTELSSDVFFKAFKHIRKIVDKSSLGSPQIMANDFKPGFYDIKNTGPQ